MVISGYIASDSKKYYSLRILSERTGISKNELAYSVRQLGLSPNKWNNKWALDNEEVLELLNYLLAVYRLKRMRRLR